MVSLRKAGVFCLALSLSMIATAALGQTKHSSTDVKGGSWYASALKLAPAAASKFGPALVKESATSGTFPPEWILAVMLTESTGQEHVRGGLMQIDRTALRTIGLRCNPLRTECAIKGATAYLNWLYQREDGDLQRTIVAYNRGSKGISGVDLDHDRYWLKVSSIVEVTSNLLTPSQENATDGSVDAIGQLLAKANTTEEPVTLVLNQ